MSKKNNKKQGGQLFQFNLTSIIDLIKDLFNNIIYAIGITIFHIDYVFFILTIISIFVYMISRINIPMIVFEYFRPSSEAIEQLDSLFGEDGYQTPSDTSDDEQGESPYIIRTTLTQRIPPITPPQHHNV